MKRIFNRVVDLIRKVTEHKVTVYAAQATLFIIISALPLLMLVISLLKFILPYDPVELKHIGIDFLPAAAIPLLYTVVDEVFTGATLPIVSITSITALWAASKGMVSLILGLDKVYSASDSRGYIKTRLLSLLYTAVFIVMILATLLFFVAGKHLITVTRTTFPLISYILGAVYSFPVIVYVVILTFIFAVLYRLLPGVKIRFLRQIPGAFVAGLGWIAFTAGYSFYMNNYADYSYIYGSLTAVVLMMLWLYFCMNIFLWGAEINCLFAERENKIEE